MVAGYPGQHWLGQDSHLQTCPPIDVLEGVIAPVLVAVLARRIPGAEYRVVTDAGHMINMEQPAAVSELLTRFVQWTR
jgi:pimeloyl-ACP methyl ester carboxylesterase